MHRIILLSLLALTSIAQDAAPTETAEARLERLLAAMGGRDAWARVQSYTIRATHYEAGRAPYANTIWNDFARPAVRIEAKGPDLNAARAIDGDRGWRRRDGTVTDLTAAQLGDEQRCWESNVYRTLHRLATRDPALRVRSVGPNRLEIWRADGVRLNWLELNKAGEPIRFGTWDSETGNIFGPLFQQGPVKCAKWGTNAAGTWKYEVVELIVSDQPSVADFQKP